VTGAVPELGRRTVRGMAWAYSSYVGQRAVVLVSTAVLARLLAPAEFGLVSLALVFIAFLETVSDFGLTQALVILDRDETRRRSQSVFLFSVAIGVAMAAATAAAGPMAARFFDEPELSAILPVLGLTLLVRAVGSTHYALAQKDMDFRARTVGELFDVVARAGVSVVLAVGGLDAWSLVLGNIAGAVAFTTALWFVVPWRPRWEFRRDALHGLVAFGGALTAVNLIAALLANVDYVFIGRELGKTQLGLYTLGFKLPELLVINFSVVAGRVLFPAFASIDEDGLSSGLVRSFHYTLVVCLPLATGLAMVAGPLVDVALGDAWLPSIDVVRAISLYALALAVGIPAGTVYKAIGRANVLLALAVPRAIIAVTAIAIFVDRGIVAVALCQAGVAFAFAAVGMLLAVRLLRVDLVALWRATWSPFVATAAMVAVVATVLVLVDGSFARLVLATVGGGAAYVGALVAVDRESLRRIVRLARRAPDPLAAAPDPGR
jgi:PST family polysaccharide transporter